MYIDVFHDLKTDSFNVVERNGTNRVIKNDPAEYFFYYEDVNGTYITTSGIKCKKSTSFSYSQFKEEIALMKKCGRQIFEHDVKPTLKYLEQHYKNAKLPTLNVAFFDIETDYDEDRGFSSAEEAFMPITSISVYQNWSKKLITFVLKPKQMLEEIAKTIVDKFENTILCNSESQMLDFFLKAIEDADIISGWNSALFDIPYLVNRIKQIRGKQDTTRFCLWKQYPKQRTVEKFGNEEQTYDLVGRLHLDYLDLYRKYTYHELPSYRLDYVAGIEVNEGKVQYNGSLNDLYNNDFEKFIGYSRQDALLLNKIDEKCKYIQLVSFVAHENLVPFSTVMGSVAISDNAIILETHDRGMIAAYNDRNEDQHDLYELTGIEIENDDESGESSSAKIAGAFVKQPIVGMHEWIGSVDIVSLYPSTFRTLNMSPETIVGQIKPTLTIKMLENRAIKEIEKKKRGKKIVSNTALWENIFEVLEVIEVQKKTNTVLTLCFENGKEQFLKAFEIYDLLRKNNWLMTANGTIFRIDREGVVPSLLTKWFKDRKDYKKEKNKYETQLIEYKKQPNTDIVKIKEIEQQIEYWDKRQHVRKIMLNSVYGALTNKGSKYYDQRMGQSCTLTGRCIVRHMAQKINEIILGKYEFGDSMIYNDTDSAYFTIETIIDTLKESGFNLTKESFIELADSIATEVNTTFADMLNSLFNVPVSRGNVISAGREICAASGLFIKKKRYACLMFDKDGKRLDKNSLGELKIMGIDTERSDTPEWVQDKLTEMLRLVLEEKSEEKTLAFIKQIRREFDALPPWKKGTPKRVNNLTHYNKVYLAGAKTKEGKTITIPGHVRAAINYNKLRELNNDFNSIKIIDGQKTIVCYLKHNNYGFTSIAYPIDEMNLPDWFTSLPFDNTSMIETIIDKKINNIIGVLQWDLDKTKESAEFEQAFTWT